MNLRQEIESYLSKCDGNFASEESNFIKFKVIYKNNHEFVTNIRNLRDGKWWPNCFCGNEILSNIIKILEQCGSIYKIGDRSIKNSQFPIYTEDNNIELSKNILRARNNIPRQPDFVDFYFCYTFL